MFSKAGLVLFTTLLAAFAPADALWPLPRSLQQGSTALTLSCSFNITIDGTIPNAPADLQQAVTRTMGYLQNDKLGRLVVGRGSVDVDAYTNASSLSTLTLTLGQGAVVNSIATEAQKAPEARDEAYTLTVPSDGSGATLSANSTLGLTHGLTTFTQLFFYHNATTYMLNAPIQIDDSPAYPYRGFMLDTARNFFPVQDVKRMLDAMSWVKQNMFHWHIVDSQSFPFEVPGYTELAQKGAYDPESVYSAQDVADVISHAGARGIDVMLEIDTPGHTAAIAQAFPEHIACAYMTPWATFANEPPAGQLRIASNATMNFTAGLLAAAAELSPSTLFSTGGDEINMPCYAADEPTQAALNATNQTFEQALNTFTQATHSAIMAKGKTPVVWEEMVLSFNLTLSNDTIVFVWISSEDAAAVAQQGFRIVHAPSNYFYLDCGAGGWVGANPSGNSWCDPFKTWQFAYSFDPLANLTDAQAPLVLGGEQLLWTEQSGPQNLDSIVWPRAGASAEVFWTGPGGNISEALPRLHEVSYRMRQRGINTINLQPKWCALRPGVCDLTA
ncbi:glycoside hydrolase family 20 protein [Phanerochaete carnosa HHB-10118-sp]|uniref:Beta-hexosaminidase n=1 Tax=Phanerochaete carnosa (strain HHB-10118-sp) TaxID=650164 RepID=K5VF85_PHACS|nr:glycoside hydrolase family 20 protein [Phanerochaete carnosa HHB-10118-sp]EKM49788.1 glycoside hydrolase family 20 protein [Phanerochaete carnosa HHB-10118-sp]